MTPIPQVWSISSGEVDLGGGVLIGVLNVTPDSFSDGGELAGPAAAIARGVELMGSGAVIIDVGGESTRPGAYPVDVNEELRRVMPVVEGLVATGVPVSIDTYKPGVASTALAAGAAVVNDVTGFRDPEMVDVVAGSDCGVIAMHMQGTPIDMHLEPRYDDIIAEVEAYLLEQASGLVDAGIDLARIVIDPGLGFGKRAHHSLALLAGLRRLSGHGLPVMIGASRKGFLASVTGDRSMEGRDLATAVITSLAYSLGARLFRVHDVPRSRDALKVAAAIVANQ